MGMFKFCLPYMLGLALGGGASAQVYESRDAQGNPVFSDKPSAGAEVVNVPPTNSADAVADAPERPRPVAAPAEPPPGSGGDTPGQRADDNEAPYFYGGGPVDYEGAQQRREDAKQRRQEAAGNPGVEPPVRVETRPTAPRPGVAGGRH